jgi:hypothetical protein
VIDELMGHQRSRHGELDGGSRIGARYRHTTDAMAVRVAQGTQADQQGMEGCSDICPMMP